MARRRVPQKREILPDPKFNDRLVAKFVNTLMERGKKSTAERIFYGSLNIVEERLKDEPLKIFKKALENLKPVVEVKSRRVGGATYQVPVEVRPDRRASLAMRWLKSYAADRPEKSMESKLAAEIMEAFNNKGNAIKKKDDTHKMAEANKAFAHYRW